MALAGGAALGGGHEEHYSHSQRQQRRSVVRGAQVGKPPASVSLPNFVHTVFFAVVWVVSLGYFHTTKKSNFYASIYAITFFKWYQISFMYVFFITLVIISYD